MRNRSNTACSGSRPNTERIVVPICREIRAAYGLPDLATAPLSQTELELVWGVNSRVFYFGVRKYVYGMPVPEDLDGLIEAEVNTFFDGIGSTLQTLFPRTRAASAPWPGGTTSRSWPAALAR